MHWLHTEFTCEMQGELCENLMRSSMCFLCAPGVIQRLLLLFPDGERYKTNAFVLLPMATALKPSAVLFVPMANAIKHMLGNWQRRAKITYCNLALSIDILQFKIALTKHLASVYA